MGRVRATAFVLLGLLWVLPSTAWSEIYRWTDAQDREHFAQNLNQVPARYRREAEDRAHGKGSKRAPSLQTYTSPGSSAAARISAGTATAGTQDGKTWRIPVQRAGTSMLVMVKLNNRVTAPFYIDTGASDVLVPQKVADQLGLDTGSGVRTKRYSTANGVIEQKVVMLKSVSLGGATVQNVPASISDSMSVGLLGLSYFNHFKYKVDTANGIVTLTRNNLADTGQIRGGRSRVQWASEYRSMHARIERVLAEYERTPDSHGRERQRLMALEADLERQLEMLESEADSAHVPSSWRR